MPEINGLKELQSSVGRFSFHDAELLRVEFVGRDVLTTFRIRSFERTPEFDHLVLALRWTNYRSVGMFVRNSHDIDDFVLSDGEVGIKGVFSTFAQEPSWIVADICSVELSSIQALATPTDHDEGWIEIVADAS